MKKIFEKKGLSILLAFAVIIMVLASCEKKEEDPEPGTGSGTGPDGVVYTAENDAYTPIYASVTFDTVRFDGVLFRVRPMFYESSFDLVGKKNGVEVSRERITKELAHYTGGEASELDGGVIRKYYVSSFEYEDLPMLTGERTLFKQGALLDDGDATIKTYVTKYTTRTSICEFYFVSLYEHATFTKGNYFKHDFKVVETAPQERDYKEIYEYPGGVDLCSVLLFEDASVGTWVFLILNK